jgi:hypothetical protein
MRAPARGSVSISDDYGKSVQPQFLNALSKKASAFKRDLTMDNGNRYLPRKTHERGRVVATRPRGEFVRGY